MEDIDSGLKGIFFAGRWCQFLLSACQMPIQFFYLVAVNILSLFFFFFLILPFNLFTVISAGLARETQVCYINSVIYFVNRNVRSQSRRGTEKRCLGKSHGSGLIGREAYLICHRGKADRTWAVCALV